MDKMLFVGIAMVVLMAIQTAVLLWRERDSIRSAINRRAGKESRKRVAQVLTDADRRAAARAAKERENFMLYDGTPQTPIDEELLGE